MTSYVVPWPSLRYLSGLKFDIRCPDQSWTKGGLISETSPMWLKSPDMGAKSRPKEKMLVIWHPFGGTISWRIDWTMF